MTEEGPFGYHPVKDPEFPVLQGFPHPCSLSVVSCTGIARDRYGRHCRLKFELIFDDRAQAAEPQRDSAYRIVFFHYIEERCKVKIYRGLCVCVMAGNVMESRRTRNHYKDVQL